MSPFAAAILATLVLSAISLIGIVFLFAQWNERRSLLFISFAAGVLLATTFLELLPEAVERSGGEGDFLVAALVAMGAFFVLERFLHGFHTHEDRHAAVSGYLILIGDTLHNFIDGVVIAATFLVDPALGVATTVAVAAHEIPQEIADYGILLTAGFSRARALLLNFLSGLSALLGAAFCFAFQATVEQNLPWFMAATGGMFIYIAASDLMPELHHSHPRGDWRVAVPFFVGIGLIALLGALTPHHH
jgi:zinc and cadmium transporter